MFQRSLSQPCPCHRLGGGGGEAQLGKPSVCKLNHLLKT